MASTIMTSETELIERTYMVTPTVTGSPVRVQTRKNAGNEGEEDEEGEERLYRVQDRNGTDMIKSELEDSR